MSAEFDFTFENVYLMWAKERKINLTKAILKKQSFWSLQIRKRKKKKV